MKSALLFFSLTFLSSAVYAGHGAGNGGNAVVCYSKPNQIQSIELFDYWEMSRAFPTFGQIDLGGPKLTVVEKVQLFTKRMAEFNPKLAKDVSNIGLSIANNINNYLIDNTEIPDVDDDTPLIEPQKPCVKETFALQIKDVPTGGRRFVIKAKIYNHPLTSNDTRAGILLHEALYRLAILNGSDNSDGVRKFNYVFASSNSHTLDLREYASVIKGANLGDKSCILEETNFGPVFHNQRNCAIFQLEKNGIRILVKDAMIRVFKNKLQSVRGESQLSNNGKVFELKSESSVSFYETGSIYSILPLKDNFFPASQFLIKIDGKSIPCLAIEKTVREPITFDLKGNIISCSLFPFSARDSKVTYKGKNYNIYESIKTDGNGQLVSFITNPATGNQLFSVQGQARVISVPQAYLVKFNSLGQLISAENSLSNENSLDFMTSFGKISTNSFSVIENKMMIKAYVSFLTPVYNNKRIILESNDPNKAADVYCKLLAFEGANSYEREQIYVSGEQELLSFPRNVSVFFHDENIPVAKSVTCYKMTEGKPL